MVISNYFHECQTSYKLAKKRPWIVTSPISSWAVRLKSLQSAIRYNINISFFFSKRDEFRYTCTDRSWKYVVSVCKAYQSVQPQFYLSSCLRFELVDFNAVFELKNVFHTFWLLGTLAVIDKHFLPICFVCLFLGSG